MSTNVLLAQGWEWIGGLGGGIGFAALCFSFAAYYMMVEWRKAHQARIEADLKREMIQKGMPAEEIERIIKAAGPPVE